ncbi:hypothetical protein MTO96_022456 [Rhipicephalus appendiculatus]
MWNRTRQFTLHSVKLIYSSPESPTDKSLPKLRNGRCSVGGSHPSDEVPRLREGNALVTAKTCDSRGATLLEAVTSLPPSLSRLVMRTSLDEHHARRVYRELGAARPRTCWVNHQRHLALKGDGWGRQKRAAK